MFDIFMLADALIFADVSGKFRSAGTAGESFCLDMSGPISRLCAFTSMKSTEVSTAESARA